MIRSPRALATLLLAQLAGLAASAPIQPFPRNEVRLTPSVWLDAQQRNADYLLSLEPDRLLHCFRVTAGLPAPGQPYGGWEDAKAGLRGHVAGGHYLSALAMMYSSTGDERFKARGDLMVSELAKCQAANPRGHVGGIPESFFEPLEQGKRGNIPYYTVHKMLAGLLAQYEECGNTLALEIATKEALYLAARNEKFTHEQLLELHVSKHEAGGVVESLWDIFALANEEKIKELALKMEQALFLNDLASKEDTLTHRHGNTHIPLVLGAVRRYELTGEARYLDLAEYFWERVVVARGWATGGTTGPGEGWGEAGKLAGIMSLTTHETCKTYNLLRLSRKLFMQTGDARYADYYSRAHLNGILGTEGPEPGQLEYYVPMATGYHRWFGFPDKSMWCCYGSGMENFSKLGDSVFFHDGDALYINQFIPCVLDWREKNFQLAIETKYPEEEIVNFVVKSGSCRLSLRILQPSWAGEGVAVSLNGKAVSANAESGFLAVEGPWKAGDRVSVRFPMSLRTIPLPDDPRQAAIAYGPVILAGIVDRPKDRFFLTSRANEPQPDSERMKRAYYFIADSPDDLSWLKPVPGKPLHFHAQGQPFNIGFQPFHSVTSERYGIYWPILSRGSDRQKQMDIENKALDVFREMDACRPGGPAEDIERDFAKFITDEAASAYHERLRLGMARVFKAAGQDAKAAATLVPLAAPFVGLKRSAEIMAIVGDEAETKGVRPLVLDEFDPGGDAAADRDTVDGVPVVKTKDARARYVYFGFTPEGKAALARKNVRITMKYRSGSAPVLHYDSATAPYAPVKPAKIETANGWKTATFNCPDAMFAGRQNLHASLRVTASDGAILMIADLKAEGEAAPPPSGSSSGSRHVIWLEAEGFAQAGGWSTDAQFVDTMGSIQLLATGCGKPVDDAVTQAAVPAPGAYRLWVRCRDWLPEHSPGLFQVSVNAKASATTFGKAKDDKWQWLDGGVFELHTGTAELRLRDLTGWWGRCDAVVLAHGDFQPSNDLQELGRQRLRHGGFSAEPELLDDFDLVVVGGGPSGLGASIAAARLGLEVALIQDRPVVGGNASSEIKIPPVGYIGSPPDRINVTGITEELFGEQGGPADQSRLDRVVQAEKNLRLFLNTRATGVEMKDRETIDSVLAVHVKTGQRHRFKAPLFVDCSGHGWIGYYAGAEYMMGQEARSQFHESMAPETARRLTQGNSLNNATFRSHKQPVDFNCPPWAYQWTQSSDFEELGSHTRLKDPVRPPNFDVPSRGKGRNPGNHGNGCAAGVWWVEYGGIANTIDDAESIRDELFRVCLGLWNYAKNHNPETREQNRCREMVWLNYVPGVRESRRLVGDYVMTQNNFDDPTPTSDAIAFTDWGIDLHHPEGFWVRGNDAIHVYGGRRTCIPYRTLYSKNIRNLFMAGRCHSATQLAFAGTRVMRPMCATGQAAGTAAALAHKHKTGPRGVYQQHLAELQQQLLKDGCYIPGVQGNDPLDLARKSDVTASSFVEGAEPPKAVNGWNRVVGDDRNAWSPSPAQRPPHWIQLSFPEPSAIAEVHLTFEKRSVECRLEIHHDGAWREIAAIPATPTRRQVLKVKSAPADAIRLVTESDVPFGICEIRAYR